MQTDDIKKIQQTLSAARKGDANAAGALVQRYAATVFRLIVHMGISAPDAEELTQDALLRAWEHIADYDPRRASFQTWLCHIAYHLALNHLRRPVLVTLSLDDDAAPSLDAVEAKDMTELFQHPDDERTEWLCQALEQLTVEEQTLVTLFYYDDLPLSDISYIVGLTSGAVAVRLHRIRQKLYHLIKKIQEK